MNGEARTSTAIYSSARTVRGLTAEDGSPREKRAHPRRSRSYPLKQRLTLAGEDNEGRRRRGRPRVKYRGTVEEKRVVKRNVRRDIRAAAEEGFFLQMRFTLRSLTMCYRVS